MKLTSIKKAILFEWLFLYLLFGGYQYFNPVFRF